MFDSVHILKNLRNNWHIEKTQSIKFKDGGEGDHLTASWADLKDLHRHETNLCLRQSKLTKAAVFPTNIEKQKVNLALYVFSEKTSAALQASSISKNSSSMASTAKFIDNVCKLWKLLNCKSFREAKRNNDPDRRVLDGTEDGAIGFALLKDWAQRAVEMRQVGNVRQQSLTRDTANAVRWTCLCLADF